MLENEIIRITNGSRLYGTHTEQSDYDYVAIYVEPPRLLFSGGNKQSTPLHDRHAEDKSAPGEDDGMGYSLRHFMNLAAHGNPSILSILFAPATAWESSTETGRKLMDNAHLFPSMEAAPRFKGYMQSQILRLKGEKVGHIPSRPELVEKYGYDVKYSLQIMRLALQGIEFFQEGYITSPMAQDQIEFLREVRNGKYSFETSLNYIENLENNMLRAIEYSALPANPDYEKIWKLSQELHEEWWNND